jgi:hypothetical protein
MKKLLFTLTLGSALSVSLQADTIRLWDFNSIQSDFVTTTGTRHPYNSSGAPARTVGGVGDQIGTVATASQPPDQDTSDDSHWRLGQINDPLTGAALLATGFPSSTESVRTNKTSGALFPVNTSGYRNIQATWYQENSASASRYWRIQYTTNGSDWLDTTTAVTASSIDANGAQSGTPVWQPVPFSVDFTGLPGVDNNPNFAFRLVSEFELTATGAGTNAYVANRVGSGYSTGGTLWLDLITVTGDSLNPANQWPVVSPIADQVIAPNDTTATLSFTVSDAETPADSLVVTAQASDTSLISNIQLGGSGGSRTIKVTAAPGQQGKAVITVQVRDAGGKVTDAGFEVAVVPPGIFGIADQMTTWNVPVTVPLLTTNLPGNPSTDWTLTGGSSNPNAVANSGIAFGPASVSNYVTITPVAHGVGATTITVTNTSARGGQAVQSFQVLVLPDKIVFFDLTGKAGNETSVAATTVSNGLSVAELSRGPGIIAASLGNGFSSSGWNNTNSTTHAVQPSRANAIAEGEYYQFAVTVQAGYRASFTSIDSSLRRTALGAPMNYEWQYSLDGFATPGVTITNFNYYGRTSGTAPTSLTPYQWMTKDTAGQDGNMTWPFVLNWVPALQSLPAGTTVTIRLYAWGNGDGADSNTIALARTNGPAIRGSVELAPSTTPPSLAVIRSGSSVLVSWPTSATGYTLQSATTLSPANWQAAGLSSTVDGTNNVVTINGATGTKFFRLVK